MRFSILAVCAGFITMATASGVLAQQAAGNYPSRPVRIIVPAAPTGVTDLQVRLAATKLAQTLGQPFVVENKPGAGTTLGTAMVAKAAPDGYTLLGMTGSFTTASVTYANLPYDPVNDLVPVSQFTIIPNLLAVHPSLPVRNVKEFVAYAKANPGKLNFGTSGAGTLAHLGGAWLEELTGAKVTFVPYKNIGAMVGDLIQGRVNVSIGSPSNLLAHVKAGKIRPLAWTGKQRSRLLPDLPTVAQQGYPEFNVTAMLGFWAPKGTPPAIVNKLSAAFAEAAKDPAIAARLAGDGTEMVGGTPEEFRTIVVSEIQRWRKLVKEAGIKLIQ